MSETNTSGIIEVPLTQSTGPIQQIIKDTMQVINDTGSELKYKLVKVHPSPYKALLLYTKVNTGKLIFIIDNTQPVGNLVKSNKPEDLLPDATVTDEVEANAREMFPDLELAQACVSDKDTLENTIIRINNSMIKTEEVLTKDKNITINSRFNPTTNEFQQSANAGTPMGAHINDVVAGVKISGFVTFVMGIGTQLYSNHVVQMISSNDITDAFMAMAMIKYKNEQGMSKQKLDTVFEYLYPTTKGVELTPNVVESLFTHKDVCYDYKRNTFDMVGEALSNEKGRNGILKTLRRTIDLEYVGEIVTFPGNGGYEMCYGDHTIKNTKLALEAINPNQVLALTKQAVALREYQKGTIIGSANWLNSVKSTYAIKGKLTRYTIAPEFLAAIRVAISEMGIRFNESNDLNDGFVGFYKQNRPAPIGQPAYGQPPHGQPIYGQPVYGHQPVYGQPEFNPAFTAPTK